MEYRAGTCKRIILTGPESTGKSILTTGLAGCYNAMYVPEYARDYISKLNRHYTYDDVLHIATKQVEQLKFESLKCNDYLFVDTYLIITKVWLIKVFSKLPDWIDDEIRKTKDDLYLLCCPDIPWEPDPLRENGGPMRQILFDMYETELKNAGLHYAYVTGMGEERLQNAKKKIDNFYLNR